MGRAFEVRKAAMAATSARKASVFNRMSKEVYLAAKAGTDPRSNAALKNALERAKNFQVPNEVVERAIKKAQGTDTENYSKICYEGFGPGGSAIIVDVLTNNVNRAVSEVRHAFTKNNGKLGVSGCVRHLFKTNAILAFDGFSVDNTMELLINKDIIIDDVLVEDGHTVVYAPVESFYEIKTALEDAGLSNFVISEIATLAEDNIKLTEQDDIEKFKRILDMLDESEDVQNVYHNVELE